MLRSRWLSLLAFVALAVPLVGCGHHHGCCNPEPPRAANAPCCPTPGGPLPPPTGAAVAAPF